MGEVDRRDVTVAGELVKSHEITTRLTDGGMRWWLHGADASLFPVEWDEQGEGCRRRELLPRVIWKLQHDSHDAGDEGAIVLA